MESRSSIVLMTADPVAKKAAVGALENHAFTIGGLCEDVGELSAYLERNTPAAAMVDIDPDPARVMASLEPIIGKFPQTRFVLMSKTFQNDLLFTAMQIGARHFLLKQSIASDAASVLHRLIQRAPEKVAAGSLVTVLSASGGCGGTTFAVNLGAELSELRTGQTLLVDLDNCYGSVATYLGLAGKYGIADVLLNAGRIDSQLVKSSALVYSEKLHVLASPASVNFSSPLPLQYEHINRALGACMEAYDFTVVDAPRVSMDVAALLAKASRSALIIYQLSVKDIRVVRAMVNALSDRGVPLEVLRPIANRYRKRNPMISLEEGQRVLGKIPLEYTSNDFINTIRGINYGQVLAQIAPRSQFRKELQELAAKIAQPRA